MNFSEVGSYKKGVGFYGSLKNNTNQLIKGVYIVRSIKPINDQNR